MLQIAGGILLAIAILYFFPAIIAMSVGLGGFLILTIIVGIILYFSIDNPQLLLVFLAIALMTKFGFFQNDNEHANNKSASQEAAFNPATKSNQFLGNGGLLELEPNQIKAIGGLKHWLRDVLTRYTPALSVKQKILKEKYYEIERPRLFLNAANARRVAKLQIDEKERRRLLEVRERSAAVAVKKKQELDRLLEKKTHKLELQFEKNIKKIRKKFLQEKNIEFEIKKSSSFIRIYRKNSLFCFYEINAELYVLPHDGSVFQEISSLFKRLSTGCPTAAIFHIKKIQNNRGQITTLKHFSEFKKTLIHMVISDSVKSESINSGT